MDAKRLKEILAEIEDNPSPSDDDIKVAGSICAVLSYYKISQSPVAQDGQLQSNRRFDFVPNSQIDELMQDLLTDFVAYTKSKAEYQIASTDANKTEMLRQLSDMLDMFQQILTMLWRSTDMQEERDKLKEFISEIVNKHIKNTVT